MSYSSLSDHRTMVFDEVRNSAYAQAIAKRVTPDSVVLDLGAGLGILGLLAAAAGARRVYLVEPESVVQLALELARANGLADRIVVLQGRIEEVELPEPVDLILSVFTGNLLYSEDLLPSLFYARDRYLKPGGHLLPDRAELLLAPRSFPQLHDTHVARWAEPSQHLNMAAARRLAANEIVWLPRKDLAGTALGEGVVVSTVDMLTATEASCWGSAQCPIDQTGVCDGLLGWIRIRLGDEWLSTAPPRPALHWANGWLPIDPPLPVTAGESLSLRLQRPLAGDWSWGVNAQAGTRQHSTFLSRLDAPHRLRKLAPASRPGLSNKGAAAVQVLSLMQNGSSNQEIATIAAAAFPLLFADGLAALQFVSKLADAYGGSADNVPRLPSH
jgi:SAM-dependent methyltransferase